jgi:ribosomal protein L37AE/L43A
MNAGWRCRECRAEFPTPSFSEGPKVVDQETLEVRRFTQALHLCPECLSPNITQEPRRQELNS